MITMSKRDAWNTKSSWWSWWLMSPETPMNWRSEIRSQTRDGDRGALAWEPIQRSNRFTNE